jgi:hypothetical protein
MEYTPADKEQAKPDEKAWIILENLTCTIQNQQIVHTDT